MNNNYCGRSCDECENKDVIHCPGCLEGPGSKEMDVCELASCCTVKGNSSCSECSYNDGCVKLRDHAETPNYIRRKVMDDIVRKNTEAELSKLAGKWQIMFFAAIAIEVFTVLCTVGSMFSVTFGIIASILAGVCSITYAAVVFSMRSVHDNYTVAGICSLSAGIFNLFVVFVPVNLIALAFVLALVFAGLSIFGIYKEYTAHSEILEDVSEDLSKSWKTLRIWYIIALALDLFFSSAFPIITLFALVFVGILRFVNLYKTTVLFEQFSD